MFSSLINPQITYATDKNCTIKTYPQQVTTNYVKIDVTIKEEGLLTNKFYVAYLNDTIVKEQGKGHTYHLSFNSDGTYTIKGLTSLGLVNTIPEFDTKFENKLYTLRIAEENVAGTLCSDSFRVVEEAGGKCEIHFLGEPYDTATTVGLYVKNIAGNPDDLKRVILKREKQDGPQVAQSCNKVKDLNNGIYLGQHENGSYYVEVRTGCDPLDQLACKNFFSVGKQPNVNSPCKEVTDSKTNKKNYVCDTALGHFQTGPESFIKMIFGILLSLSGGIAVLLIIISGYRLMTSQGNPEKIQAAREQLTSAIIGLVFIIFSLSILQIIGVDILKIPGFSR